MEVPRLRKTLGSVWYAWPRASVRGVRGVRGVCGGAFSTHHFLFLPPQPPAHPKLPQAFGI